MSSRPAAILLSLTVLALTLTLVATAGPTDSKPSADVVEALRLAVVTYGHGDELWRKARCETAGTFDPRSRNPRAVSTKHGPEHASGLFQFLPSTWAQTPYRRLSIWSPYASAMAAGWMHAHGRGGEWSCS